MGLKRSKDLTQDEYDETIAAGLNGVYAPDSSRRRFTFGRDRSAANRLLPAVQAEDLKIVIFSDLHRGDFDKADDFRRCHRAYRAALGWYLEHGYALWLLGDIEELWENKADVVIERYEEVLALERRFTEPGRGGLRRFYGNHDLDWSKRKRADSKLGVWLAGAEMLESVRLPVEEDGERLGLLFFVHGHQGTPTSDTFAFASRFVVGTAWRALQKSQGWIATTPSESTDLRGTHDNAMLRWAMGKQGEPRGSRPILFAGHTHHPIFPGKPPDPPTQAQVDALQAELDAATGGAARAATHAKRELAAAVLWEQPYPIPAIDPPCYFNTGCGSFPDGDVTCIEIDGSREVGGPNESAGKIRLMRWLNNDGEPEPHELAASPLREVLARVNAA